MRAIRAVVKLGLSGPRICERDFSNRRFGMATSPQSEADGKVGGIHRPSLFIGSSTEGLEFARAARRLLNQDAEVSLWNEGLFRLGDTFIEILMNGLSGFDFRVTRNHPR